MNIADLIRSCPVDLTPMLRKSWSPVAQFTDPGLYERLDRFKNDNLPCNIDKNGVLHYASGSNYRIKDWVVMKNYALVTLASQVVQGNTMTGQVYRVHGYFGHSKPPEVEPMQENEERKHFHDLNILEDAIRYYSNEQIPCYVGEDNKVHFSPGGHYIIEWTMAREAVEAEITLIRRPEPAFKRTIRGVEEPNKKELSEWLMNGGGQTKVDVPVSNVAVRSTDADAVAFHLISPIALERIAARYQLGSEKYGAFNWTKGFSWGQLLNHSLRHIFHYLAGDRREDHLAGAAWGLITLMHYEHTKTGTDDIYRYVETYDGILVGDSNQPSPRTPTGTN